MADIEGTKKISELPVAIDISSSDTLVGVQGGATKKFPYSVLRGTVSVKDFSAIGDGTTITDAQIQAALNSGAKSVFLPDGVWLLDNDLSVPPGVTFFGNGDGSVLRMVGRDTHSRNCALFDKYQGSVISAAPAMVVLVGSNSLARNFVCDGNGLNNYVTPSGFPVYIDEGNNLGYCGVRIGRLNNRAPADPKTFIEHSNAEGVTVKLTAWGGVIVAGFGYRFAPGDVTTDEDLIGARYCHIRNCTTINTFSNNIAFFSAKHCSVTDPVVVNNVHKGVSTYVRCRDILIKGVEFIYDPTTDVSWKGDGNVANYRERELSTRSDAIAVGHSDYNTLMERITVVGCKLNGNGMIRNGINVYSNTKDVTLLDNDVTGFVSPLAVGVSAGLAVSGGSLSSVSYTTTDFVPGTQFIGSDLQFTARSIENTKTRPAAVCVQHYSGILFRGGSGVNNIRGNAWTVWDALDAGLQAHFSANTYDTQGLTSFAAATAKHAELNTAPTSSNPSSMHFENEKYVAATGNSFKGPDLFSSNVLWSFVWPLGLDFTFTPVPVGSTAAGVATITSADGLFRVGRGTVEFSLQAGWSAHTGTGNLRITGLPIPSRSTADGGIPRSLSAHFSGLTFSGQVAPAVQNSSSTIDLYQLASGAGLVNVPMDTVVSVLRISGGYEI